MTRPTRATLDLKALVHNAQRVREFAPNSRLMAMVKANAYGHGAAPICQTLQAYCDGFGVACLSEAIQLRQTGVTKPILLLAGFFSPQDLQLIADNELELVIHQAQQIDTLEKTSLAKPLRVWLKVDTGMHRLGFSPQQVRDAWQRLQACSNIQNDLCLMTHFSDGGDRQAVKTQQQLETFKDAVAELGGEQSLAHSAAVMSLPASHGDWVRPGIMLYGVSPFNDSVGEQEGLQPVMTLHSQLMAIHQLRAGDTIGYGSTWQCPEDMAIGVIPVGYGDGYPRHAKAGTPVLINDQRVSLVGRVSMDMITVDLRPLAQVQVGDPVVLWGKGLPAEEVAAHADTIAYELFCHVTQRVVFNYIK